MGRGSGPLVGDPGTITQARIEEDIKPAGLDWITALRAPQIRALVDSGIFQLSLFDERDLASITADDYPGERLIVCRNPELAVARRRKRQDLLAATERDLAEIQNRVRRTEKPLRGTAKIALKAQRPRRTPRRRIRCLHPGNRPSRPDCR